jgi:hypothetical protein
MSLDNGRKVIKKFITESAKRHVGPTIENSALAAQSFFWPKNVGSFEIQHCDIMTKQNKTHNIFCVDFLPKFVRQYSSVILIRYTCVFPSKNVTNDDLKKILRPRVGEAAYCMYICTYVRTYISHFN